MNSMTGSLTADYADEPDFSINAVRVIRGSEK